MNEKLLFATSNSHKLLEVKDIFEGLYKIVGLDSIGFTGIIPETQNTIPGNARQKVEYIASYTDLPVFAEDTGLLVDTLQGAPGVHSARYAGPGKSDQDNVEKLLNDLRDSSDRKAHFLTVVAFRNSEGNILTFHGKVHGTITDSPRGKQGFGYDSVFQPDGYDKTFGELSAEIKNKISHRRKAFDQMLEHLRT